MSGTRSLTVRGLLFHGPGRAPTIETFELDPPGPGEVRVRMLAAGVCHSDLHVVDGHWARPAQVILGHEGTGVVEALGPGVVERAADAPLGSGGLRVGDLVSLAWTAPCGACHRCRSDQPWLCGDPRGGGHRLDPALVRIRRRDGQVVGAYSGIGTFCTAQVVAAEAAIPIDPRTPPEVAALIGCAATTGVGAVRSTAGVGRGESVAILGLGGVGLAALIAAVGAGAEPVIAVDPAPAKLEVARSLGATEAIAVDDLAVTAGRVPGGGLDHVLECSGRADAAELAIRVVRPGGCATLVGMPPMGERASFDVYRFVEEGKRILGSNYGSCRPGVDFPRIASEVLDGRLPLDRLVSRTIGLEEVDGAFEAMRRGEGLRQVIRFVASAP